MLYLIGIGNVNNNFKPPIKAHVFEDNILENTQSTLRIEHNWPTIFISKNIRHFYSLGRTISNFRLNYT